MAYGTYSVKVKKCATCRWWDGQRCIELRAYKPTYVHALTGSYACLAQRSKQSRAVDRCSAWALWEKLG